MARSSVTPPAGIRGGALRVAVVASLSALTLIGCADGGADPITTASIPNGSTVGGLPPGVPGETLEARLARLEFDLAQLKLDYSIVRPSFEMLVSREKDLDLRLAVMEDALGPITASIPRTSDPSSPPPPRPAPTATAPQPEMPASPAPTAPDTAEAIGLHLASYRSRDRLADGWAELLANHPAELSGLNVRIQRIDTGESGVFQRLLAGPVASRTAADGLCRALSTQGVYCKTVAFSGDAL
ncbi:hypothetical protein [Pyruvatibacter sp.]|uniref:SPOR domain-containing protein n=1 Tax=Pyruvatibacter sp. TaxID=1981328 RepID=UPI0032EF8176